jgi:glycolate oxidase iron-sulfur subunit
VAADDAALLQHLDSCLGCRGCEPVCPAGVGYGKGLEAARELLADRRGLRPLARAVLAVFSRRWLWRPLFGLARWVRGLGLARSLAGSGSLGFSMGMVAATEPRRLAARPAASSLAGDGREPTTVALFRGCVMDALFGHVHDATRRTLERNGYRVVEVTGQGCCGALHEHAGDRAGASALARANVAAFLDQAELIVVNSAGCGALLKEYGHLLESADAAEFGRRVRDVTELLADRGPVPGAPLDLDIAYDAPCHLQHAQKVHAAPLAVLSAIPGLRLQQLPGSDRCCGSAGIYSLLEPAMSRAVLDAKVEAIALGVPRPMFVATGNPGCLMQIGAGLRAAGLPIRVVHPVELLDWSYGGEGGGR